MAVLKVRDFRYFIFVRFFLIFAVYAQHTVISYHLFQLTKDPWSLGLLGLAEVIPAFVFSLPAGYLADRMDKRKMYLYCVVVYLLISISFLILTYPTVEQSMSLHTFSALIYILVFINGAARASLAPASFSLLPLLIEREKYSRAITWSSSAWYMGAILGPLAGGALMALVGIHNVIWVVIVCIILSFVLMYAVRVRFPSKVMEASVPILESLKQGLAYVFKTEIVWAVMCLDLFAVLFGGAEALLPAFANQILKVGETGYGWLRSAHGIGYGCMVLGAVLPSSFLYQFQSRITSTVATLSYAVYLIHKFVIHLTQMGLQHLGMAEDSNAVFIISIVSVLICAALMHVWLEKPMARWRNKWLSLPSQIMNNHT